jgi:hypothetical protein
MIYFNSCDSIVKSIIYENEFHLYFPCMTKLALISFSNIKFRINKTWWKVWSMNGLEVMMVSKLRYMTYTFMILRVFFFSPPNYINIPCLLFSIIGFLLMFNVALIVHINYVVYISCVLERIRERNQRKIVLYNIDKCLIHES